jgi:hypothetical protein
VLGRRGEGLGRWAGCSRGRGERPTGLGLAGWARKKRERGRESVFVFFFFQISFKFIFQTFTLKSNKKSMHSNHDAQALIFSKLF